MSLMSHLHLLVLLLATCGCLSAAQQQQTLDPLNNFCRRFAHQTTVIGNRLFVDGGLVDYGNTVYPSTVNDTNTYLLYLDLDTLNEYNFPTEYANLSKPSEVPSVQGGILWADTVNQIFYLYGGEYNWTTSPPSQYTLWAYDAVYNNWSATPSASSSSGITGVSFGAGTVVDASALAFYYGGYQSNATVLGWNGGPIAQTGLIVYDMINNDWKNTSFFDQTPRAEGVMLNIPASDSGMLIYLGGIQQTSNGSYVGVS